jgi:hypothetical protein
MAQDLTSRLLTVRRPMKIIPSVSCAAESVMEKDPSLLIGLLYSDQ